MWGTDGGGHPHSKNLPVSYKQHKDTYTLYAKIAVLLFLLI